MNHYAHLKWGQFPADVSLLSSRLLVILSSERIRKTRHYHNNHPSEATGGKCCWGGWRAGWGRRDSEPRLRYISCACFKRRRCLGPPGAAHTRSCFLKPEEPRLGRGGEAEGQQCAFMHVCLERGFLPSVCRVSIHMIQVLALTCSHLLLSYALGHPIALQCMCVSGSMCRGNPQGSSVGSGT